MPQMDDPYGSYGNFLPGDVYTPENGGGIAGMPPGGYAPQVEPIAATQGGPSGVPSTPSGGGNFTVDQLKQLVTAYDPTFLQSILPQLQAAGVEVQNQARGDLRPRFRLPDGSVWDYGPGGWVSRGTAPPGFGDATQAPGGGGGGMGGGAGAPGGGSMQDWLNATPGHQFALQQGIDAIQKSAAAKGTLLTGGTEKGIAGYATGLADQLYGNQYQRYLDLLKLGMGGIGQGTS